MMTPLATLREALYGQCRICVVVAGALLIGIPPATAETRLDLQDILVSASAGEVVRLPPGNYGSATLEDLTVAEGVTLTSEDRDNPAVFTRFALDEVENLIIDGLLFDYTFSAGDSPRTNLLDIDGGANLTIRNSVFDGDVASGMGDAGDGYGAGTAISSGGSKDLLIENNEIFNFQRGLAVAYGTNNIVRGNDIHSIRHDGMNIIQMTGITIEDNYIHDFRRAPDSGDHVDMIQFWTRNKKVPTTGIIIRGNVLSVGTGDFSQSIFIRNEAVDDQNGGRAMFYKDVIVANNVIINGHLHGITIGETDGLLIENNTLIRVPTAAKNDDLKNSVRIPRINVAEGSQHVTIRNNMAVSWPKAQPGWTVEGNLPIQDQTVTRAGYYHKIFVAAQLGDPASLNSFVYRGEGAVAAGVGASVLRPDADRSQFSAAP